MCFGPKLNVSVLTSSYSTFQFLQDPIYHHNFHETQELTSINRAIRIISVSLVALMEKSRKDTKANWVASFFPPHNKTVHFPTWLRNISRSQAKSQKLKIGEVVFYKKYDLILRKLATKEEETIPFWRLVDGWLVIKVTCIIFIKQFLTHGVFISISRSYLYLPSFRTHELYYTRILFFDFCSKPVSPRSSTTPTSVTHSNI